MLRRVALVRTDVSEESITSVIRVTRIGNLGATLAETSNRNTNILPPSSGLPRIGELGTTLFLACRFLATLMMEVNCSSKSLFLKETWRNIAEDGILHSHCHANLKSYLILKCSLQYHATNKTTNPLLNHFKSTATNFHFVFNNYKFVNGPKS
jgi:hypothetical protein